MMSNNPFDEPFEQSGHQNPQPMAPAARGPVTAPAASATRPAASAPIAPIDDRRELVKFRVDAAFKGSEVLRPITYFPICTEVLADNDGHYTVPDIPQGPHQAYVTAGVRRNDWTQGSYAMAERRYSELLDLRELLTLQFPTIIIPPLPTKNSVRDVETFFGAGDSIMGQRCSIQLFLKEIAAMPEVVFFSDWVPPFFLDPRDSFETSTLPRMRTALKDLCTANKFLDDLSDRKRNFTDDTAGRIATTSSKIIRSVTGLFFPSGGGGDGQRQSDWSSLSEDDKADAAAWQHTMGLLSARRTGLKNSAKVFERHLANMNACNAESAAVAGAMEAYEATLNQSNAFTRLGEPWREAAGMVGEVARVERAASEGKYLNVCLRLSFEASFVDCALDAADHVLSIYRAATDNPYDSRDPARAGWLLYAGAISRALRADYQMRYKRYYTQRMRNLVVEQISRPSIERATATDTVVRTSGFSALVRSPTFV